MLLATLFPKRRKEKKRQCYCPEREREREREQLEENIGIFVNQEKIHSQSVFSQFWGENILMGPGR